MKVSARVHVSGPLVPYVAGFAATLRSQGYTDLSLANQLRLGAHLSRWLAERALGLTQLTAEVVEQFVADRRETHTALCSVRGLAPLLQYLQKIDVVPAAAPEPAPSNEVLRAYERYLVEERVVKPRRRRYYVEVAREFLADRQVADLVAADVARDVRAHVDRADLPERLTALRAVLSFLFVRGHAPINLVHAVPSASRRRLVSLPKGLDMPEIRAVLANCDRRTTMGRRNYAALLLMVRRGLRAGEVAALTLDDIDWEAGEIVVHGKGTSIGRLPLPTDVGEAIVSYLRRRRPPQVESRSLFLRSRAPHRGGTAAMFTGLASHSLRAAGVSSGGSHRLRHTAATQMLRAGASLTEIAQVLRHRHVDTTAIYAKVDRDGLRTLAPPWPTVDFVYDEQLRRLAQPWPGGAA
jgi:integrase/recombinase XerD